MQRRCGPFRVISQDRSIPGTTDDLIVPDIEDFVRAVDLAGRLTGPTCRAWIEDAEGTRLWQSWPTKQSA
jgi:hypothetical protein